MNRFRIVGAILAVVALAACRSEVTEPWAPVPDIVTVSVIAVEPPSEFTRVLVGDDERPELEGATSNYWLVISSATTVLVRESNGKLVQGDARDIRPGDSVHAWRTGIELRSLPPQYPVSRVIVMSSATR